METKSGPVCLGGMGIGSGVILQIEHGSALIVTNRHVVDANPRGEEGTEDKRGLPDGRLQIKLIGQASHPGKVVWTAPDGIDLALVRVDVDGQGDGASFLETQDRSGNRQRGFHHRQSAALGLDPHSRQHFATAAAAQGPKRQVHVIQTDAPLNTRGTAAADCTISRAR